MLSRNASALTSGPAQMVRKGLLVLSGIAALAATSACVITPVQPGPVMIAPQRAYVAPTYASPGVGWVWESHPAYGWGWHHPERGWHQGWR